MLGVGERQPAAADLGVQLVLDLVDLCRARIRLGPEVARVGRVPAELEADQMILLVGRRRPAQPVLAKPLLLQVIRVGRQAAGSCASSRAGRSCAAIVACVTAGLTTPGVSVQLASTAAPRARGREQRGSAATTAAPPRARRGRTRRATTASLQATNARLRAQVSVARNRLPRRSRFRDALARRRAPRRRRRSTGSPITSVCKPRKSTAANAAASHGTRRSRRRAARATRR